MTGLEVTEVNITVFDVMLFEDAESGGSTDPEAKPRVQ